jgi:NAD(P)-dependent dehydrogenase (short-subunit alcohol dehydrogenase family)
MNKVAVVTGAGSGIGRHSALALVEAGFTTVLAGRRQAPLDETAAAAAPGKTLAVVTDVAKRDDVELLFKTVRERFGRVDVLFNNAGLSVPAPFEDLPLEKWEEVVSVNLTGAFLCAQAAFRLMKDQRPQGGRIINNGSISAHVPRPNSVAYTSTKHAITGLTKSISLDGRKYDIACGQIDVGNASTPMTQRMPQGTLQANGRMEAEPTMDVENVARSVVFMAGLPLDANVQFMTVMATKMPFIGRG